MALAAALASENVDDRYAAPPRLLSAAGRSRRPSAVRSTARPTRPSSSCSPAGRSSTISLPARLQFRPTSRSRPPPSPAATAFAPIRSAAAPRCTPGSISPGPYGTPIYATADGTDPPRRLEQRRLRQPHRDRPWPRHRNPLRPPFARSSFAPGQQREARPADRPHGLDRPFDRQPPALRSPHRRPCRSIRSRS